MIEVKHYCQCKERISILPGLTDEEGYWFICGECGLPIEGEYNYFDRENPEDADNDYKYDWEEAME